MYTLHVLCVVRSCETAMLLLTVDTGVLFLWCELPPQYLVSESGEIMILEAYRFNIISY